MVFNEDSRVKIPCILHLARLGYAYISLKNATWDEETNIFPDLFRSAIARINPDLNIDDVNRLLADVKLSLENEDLGKAFYEMLTERSGVRLIDFVDFSNNSFHVVTELPCKNGDDSSGPISPCSSTACRWSSSRSKNLIIEKACWPSVTVSSLDAATIASVASSISPN